MFNTPQYDQDENFYIVIPAPTVPPDEMDDDDENEDGWTLYRVFLLLIAIIAITAMVLMYFGLPVIEALGIGQPPTPTRPPAPGSVI